MQAHGQGFLLLLSGHVGGVAGHFIPHLLHQHVLSRRLLRGALRVACPGAEGRAELQQRQAVHRPGQPRAQLPPAARAHTPLMPESGDECSTRCEGDPRDATA